MDNTRPVKPAQMALCRECSDGIRLHYAERLHEGLERYAGICGLCGRPAMVHSCDLYPNVKRAYRRRYGGGERSRAGR